MKTNIEKLAENVYGAKIGEALYAVGGCAEDGWDTEITGIYKLIDGNIVAYNGFMVFPADETSWDISSWRPAGRHGRANKKAERNCRIDEMCGVWWNKETGLKKYGKNRELSRRMAPNSKQVEEFENYLPF